jgi:CheY-like chemotaxis protein
VIFSVFFGGSPDGLGGASAAHSALDRRGRLAQPTIIRTLLADESDDFLAGASLWMVGRPELVIVGRVRSGLEVLEAVDDLRPDLVIMDGVLPGLDGFRVTRFLKSLPDPPLVVLATFVTSKAARDEALAAGADGFIAKDEFAGGLERLLDELLARRREPEKKATSRETPAPLGWRSEQDL